MPPGPPMMAEEAPLESCATCRFWQADGGNALGLCTMISGLADVAPDETDVGGADFLCGPDWFCAYYEEGAPEDAAGGAVDVEDPDAVPLDEEEPF